VFPVKYELVIYIAEESPAFYRKQDVSDAEFCPSLKTERSQFRGSSSILWTQLSRSQLQTGTHPSFRIVMFQIKGRTTDNVQDCDSYS
jgi:hypothetical protein